jgi:hypothetical protein
LIFLKKISWVSIIMKVLPNYDFSC